MAQHLRRETTGYTRFVLALSLSTVTAIAVAAPLAIRAIRADQTVAYAGPGETGGFGQPGAGSDDELSSAPDRSLGDDDDVAKGGIDSALAKSQAQTSKSAITTTGEDPSAGDTDETGPEAGDDSTTSTAAATTTSAPSTTTTTVPPTTTTSTSTPTTATSATGSTTSSSSPASSSTTAATSTPSSTGSSSSQASVPE
jgi:hypothetical protein